MAVYRYQVVSVGWWRGQIKRWNTTFHFSAPNATNTLRTKMNAVGYPNPGDVEGDCSGGVASISVYASTGGAPIAQAVYFDWQTPSEWIPYDGTVWSSITVGTPIDASGESAAVVVGQLPGLSITGKPTSTRKYLHAIPSRTESDYANPDISTAVQALIVAQFTESWMGTAAGVIPDEVLCEPYYFNHQRVRGRRRSTAEVQGQSFSAGVVAGAAAAGGGAPFQAR